MPFKTQTVLVLGAGASVPYGFPLGVGLRDHVCALSDNLAYEVLFRQLGYADGELQEFIDELRYSGHTSVDVFLEHNPAYLPIGKHAIAAVLLPLEKTDALFPPRAKSAKNWYEFLVNRMGVGTADWETNKLAVVTFNYDRSLEHYFTTVIGRRAGVDMERALKLLKAIPIVHVHGSLGKYSPTGKRGTSYGLGSDTKALKKAGESILVVSEVDDDLHTFAKAEKLLRKATVIYFLGFGFQPDNVRRLRVFSDSTGLPDTMYISGTTVGIPERDWIGIREDVLNGCWSGKRCKAATVADFLSREALQF